MKAFTNQLFYRFFSLRVGDTTLALLLFLAVISPSSVLAEEYSTASFEKHLDKMKTHTQKMRVMLDKDTECGELERRHMLQMTDHMEMMMKMMENMHKEPNSHPMRHD